MRFLRAAALALLAAAIPMFLASCSMLDKPGAPSYQGETGSVQSIEMAWEDGRGMGSFVSAIVPNDPTLHYRIRIVFDSGVNATYIQDGSTPLAVGERAWVQGGRLVEHDVPFKATPPRELHKF